MNKDEVTSVDAAVMKELDSVDWHSVPEAEAARFGLAVGFFRDSNHACQLRRTALGTALGSVLSMTVLTILAMLLGADAQFILPLLLVHQAIRCFVLFWRSRQATKEHTEIERQAVETARSLAERYPTNNTSVAT